MSVLVAFNGSQYLIPVAGETGWASPVTNILVDLGNNAVSLVQSQTMTNKILQLQAGSAGSPSLAFTADTASGIYQPTTSQIAFSTASTQRLLLDASGNLSVVTGNLVITAGNQTVTAGNITMTAGNVLLAGASSAVTGSGVALNLTTSSANDIVFKPNATEYLRLSSAGAITFSNGASLTSPTMTGSPIAPTQSSADNSTKVATTAFVGTAVAAGPGVQNSGRNFIHNPGFTVQQHTGTPWTAAGNYTADRWFLSLVNDTDSVTIATLADADRTAIGDEYAQYALQDVYTGSATASSYSGIFQRIEGVRRTANKSVTVSFWAKASSGTPKIGIALTQNFGSGGSPSTAVNATGTQTANLSTTWTQYTATIALASVAGKTFGSTASTDYLQLGLLLSDKSNTFGTGMATNQTGTVLIYGVQLEIGSAATALERRDPAVELELCQRFFQYHTSWQIFFISTAVSQACRVDYFFPTTMRAFPSTTFDTTSFTNGSTLTVNSGTISHIQLQFLAAASGQSVATFNASLSSDL